MKAMTIKQPWAWAICNLPMPFRKCLENRSRPTKHRGPLAIHAGKGFDREGYLRMQHYLEGLGYSGHVPSPDEFVYGAVIGQVNVVGCVQASSSRWFEGPFAYVLENALCYEAPVPWSGQLGMWNFPDEKVPLEISTLSRGKERSRARLGRQLEHFAEVDLGSIAADFKDGGTWRYSLSFSYRCGDDLFRQDARSEHMVVVLKNPSSADAKKADKTIRNVQGYVHRNFPDVKNVTILNLFAYRATDTEDLQAAFLEQGAAFVVGAGNDEAFIDALSSANYVIVAWGGRSKIDKALYDKRIKRAWQLLASTIAEDVNVYRVDPGKGSDDYPFHATFWGMKFERRMLDINEKAPALLSLADYRNLREQVRLAGYGREYEWAQTVKKPICSNDFLAEYIWVVVNSGMKNQIAEKIMGRIVNAIKTGQDISGVFGHKKKVEAIKYVMENKDRLYREFIFECDTDEKRLEFCGSLPHIGDITKYHLAKNYGTDCAKPDRHLIRIAEKSGESVVELCVRLSKMSGDRVATVDVVLWRAANLGML